MKILNKSIIIVVVISAILTIGCADTRIINDIKYNPPSLPNDSEKKNPNVERRLIDRDFVCINILIESIKDPDKIIGSIEEYI